MTGWDLAPARFSPHASLAWAVGVGILWLGFFLFGPLRAWLAHRRHFRAARAATLGRAGEGLVVLNGVVAQEGTEPAITIAIEQEGCQFKSKNGTFVAWKESRRKTEVHPFELVQADGRRVRVEPNDRVLLVDKLETTLRQGAHRTRAAKLESGEPAHIIGVLDGGASRQGPYRDGPYRDSAAAPVLRPPRAARMLISTTPFEDRYRRRVLFHGWWVVGTVLPLSLAYLLLFGNFLALGRHGRVVTATVERAYTYVVRTKNGSSTHYAIVYTYVDPVGRGARENSDVDRKWFSRMTPGVTVPVLVWPRLGLSQLGDRATVTWVALPMALSLTVTLFILYLSFAQRSRPWYERERLAEVEAGRLDG